MDAEKQQEYQWLTNLEIETTKFRYTTFTALVSISFVVAGLAVNANSPSFRVLGQDTNLSRVVFFLGFVFCIFATFHYLWYHRYSHRYRKHLKELERDLGIEAYRLRGRPTLGPLKLHFHFGLYVVGLVYGLIAISYVGLYLFLLGAAFVVGGYFILLLLTLLQPTEPNED